MFIVQGETITVLLYHQVTCQTPTWDQSIFESQLHITFCYQHLAQNQCNLSELERSINSTSNFPWQSGGLHNPGNSKNEVKNSLLIVSSNLSFNKNMKYFIWQSVKIYSIQWFRSIHYDKHLRFTNHVETLISKSRPAYHAIVRLKRAGVSIDRKSTRLNSSHTVISYAVFCLKKKTKLLMTHSNIFIYKTPFFC